MALCNLNGDICATGDMSDINPSIHVWNTRNMENISVLFGIHHTGIHLLAFSSDDKFLITAGLGDPSAILIYDWRTAHAIISVSVKSPTQDILVIRGMNPWAEPKAFFQIGMEVEPKPVEGFVLISLDSLIIFVFDEKIN